MKKIALTLLVLAFTVPALADVEITATNDQNEVTVSYNNTGGEMVRAFALEIAVTGGAYYPGSEVGNDADYYVWPGSITFTVEDGNTVIDELGNPVAESDANGGVIEMASLYAANDPCHPTPPPSSGTLVTFAVDCDATVTLSLNAQRGGVVLEDPDVVPTVVLPAPLLVECDDIHPAWTCPGQELGDATGDGRCNTFDLLALRKAWGTNADTSPHGTAQGEYNCASDHTRDGRVNTFDLLRIRQNWGRSDLGTCPDMSCLP